MKGFILLTLAVFAALQTVESACKYRELIRYNNTSVVSFFLY